MGGSKLLSNTVALGAALGIVGYDLILGSTLTQFFSKKGEDIAKKNIDVAKAGYEYVKANFKDDLNFGLKPTAGSISTIRSLSRRPTRGLTSAIRAQTYEGFACG